MAEQCGDTLFGKKVVFEGGDVGAFDDEHLYSSFARRVHMLEGENKGLDYNSLASFIKGEKVPCYRSYKQSNPTGEAADFFVVPLRISFKTFGVKKLEIEKVQKGKFVVADAGFEDIRVLSRAQFIKEYISAEQYLFQDKIKEMFGKTRAKGG